MVLGRTVGAKLVTAVRALSNHDQALARQIIAEDEEINRKTEMIEEWCLRLLALQQPLASDLRVISTALKIVTDLERLGDHAVNLARAALEMSEPPIQKWIEITYMAMFVDSMIDVALQAYTDRDIELADRLADMDDEVDFRNKQLLNDLIQCMQDHPEHVSQFMHLMLVCRALERVGDHVTNIGEHVIYMVTGERKELNR
jgi:phosphate transport system protein